MDRNARNITREFVEVLNAVILDEALGQNADRLRNVDKRRVRLRRDRSTVGIDARRSGACVLRIGGELRSRLCRGDWRRLWRRWPAQSRRDPLHNASGSCILVAAHLDASPLNTGRRLIYTQARNCEATACAKRTCWSADSSAFASPAVTAGSARQVAHTRGEFASSIAIERKPRRDRCLSTLLQPRPRASPLLSSAGCSAY